MGFSIKKRKIEEAYEKYADILYRIALARVQKDSDAQDIVQEAFIKYMGYMFPFKDENHEKAWLIKATVNLSLDTLKKNKVRAHVSLDEAIAKEKEEDLSYDVFEKLSLLPEKYRVAVTLHYLEGYSVSETASMLGISLSAAKMRLSRGREAFSDILKKEDDDV